MGFTLHNPIRLNSVNNLASSWLVSLEVNQHRAGVFFIFSNFILERSTCPDHQPCTDYPISYWLFFETCFGWNFLCHATTQILPCNEFYMSSKWIHTYIHLIQHEVASKFAPSSNSHAQGLLIFPKNSLRIFNLMPINQPRADYSTSRSVFNLAPLRNLTPSSVSKPRPQ